MSKTEAQNVQEVAVKSYEQEPKNEVAVREDVFNADQVTPAIFEQGGQQIFTTLKGETREDKIKQYNAVNASKDSLSDNIGEVFEITDMVAHPITLEDEITHEPINALRVVLIDSKGEAHYAISKGVVSSLQKIIGIVGPGPWQPALKIVPQEVKTRKGFKTTTLRLVP